ncbi:MAG: hypothetical protein AW07_02345 [Candidatus Accumulibacter sp. SK-11]|nr:MAG: hypothetical protein AW07_02345 [Candidatus Accumulibacter sp. SK-11]
MLVEALCKAPVDAPLEVRQRLLPGEGVEGLDAVDQEPRLRAQVGAYTAAAADLRMEVGEGGVSQRKSAIDALQIGDEAGKVGADAHHRCAIVELDRGIGKTLAEENGRKVAQSGRLGGHPPRMPISCRERNTWRISGVSVSTSSSSRSRLRAALIGTGSSPLPISLSASKMRAAAGVRMCVCQFL